MLDCFTVRVFINSKRQFTCWNSHIKFSEGIHHYTIDLQRKCLHSFGSKVSSIFILFLGIEQIIGILTSTVWKNNIRKSFLRLGQLLISCLFVFLSILRIKLICEVSNVWQIYLCSIIFMRANAVALSFMTYFLMLYKQIYVNCVTHFPS